MSEVSTGATDKAPPVAPTEAQPVQQQEAAPAPQVETPAELDIQKPKSRSDARKNVAERMKAREARAQADAVLAEQARQRALEQPRKEAGTPEGGQFTKDGQSAEGQAPTPEGAAAAEASVPATGGAHQVPSADPAVDTTGTSPAPEGMVDIPLAEGHPLRERGRTFIRVAKEFEADARNFVNEAVRRREVEAERDRLARENALFQARQQALSGDLPDDHHPAVAALIEQVRAAGQWGEMTGDQLAEHLLEGIRARRELLAREAEGQASQEFEMTQTLGRVESEINANAPRFFQVWAQNNEMWRVPQLVVNYVRWVDSRNAAQHVDVPPSAREFFEFAKQHYVADPRVQQQIQAHQQQSQQRTEAQIRADERARIEEERRQAQEEAARRHAARPPLSRGVAPSSQSTTPTTDSEQAPPAPAPVYGQGRKHARQRAAEIAERMLGHQPR